MISDHERLQDSHYWRTCEGNVQTKPFDPTMIRVVLILYPFATQGSDFGHIRTQDGAVLAARQKPMIDEKILGKKNARRPQRFETIT